MQKPLIMSIISDDTPGIVKHLADIVKQYKGNWLESNFSQLAGKFAGIAHITIDEQNDTGFRRAISKLNGITISIDDAQTHSVSTGQTANFSASGPDRPGIVLEITSALSQREINLNKLETQRSSMPYSGEPIFKAKGEIDIPDYIDIDELTSTLEDIGDSLAMDIYLTRTDNKPSD